MNLNQLKYFIAVAEYRSFTKAAEQYFLTQTAITQQIQRLEDAVGAQLIDRKTRPISLTPMGQVFLREARAVLKRMDHAVQRTRQASTGISGTLRIGYTVGYEHSDLIAKLRQFHQDYPNVLIICSRDDTDQLTSGLIKGEYDMIFTWDSTNICKNEAIDYRLQEKTRYIMIPAATEAFRLSRAPFIGRETAMSHFSAVRRLIPSPSAPMTSAVPPRKSTFS